MKRLYYPRLKKVRWLGGKRLSLLFSTGHKFEIEAPVDSYRQARTARIVDCGIGVYLGAGLDRSSASLLHNLRQRKEQRLARAKKNGLPATRFVFKIRR